MVTGLSTEGKRLLIQKEFILINVQQFNSYLTGNKLWSLTLREEHRLRVFENRVLGRIFGQKGDEVTGNWRKLHNEELHNSYLRQV
jgi:hypothetical protein